MVSGWAKKLEDEGIVDWREILCAKDYFDASPVHHHFRMAPYACALFDIGYQTLKDDFEWYLASLDKCKYFF